MVVGLVAAIGLSAVLVLGAVVLAPGYVPARRATKVQPLEALRGE